MSLPSRSRLYRLAPIGLGTAYVESLTSYIIRLAEAHSLPVGYTLPHVWIRLTTVPTVNRAEWWKFRVEWFQFC